MKLVMFDDRQAQQWEPFALTRPVGELLFGAYTQRRRCELRFDAECVGHVGADHLHGFEEPGAPPVISMSDVVTTDARVFMSARAVPDWGHTDWPPASAPIAVGGQIAGWYAAAGDPNPPAEFFHAPSARNAPGTIEIPGNVIDHPWSMIAANPDRITQDAQHRATQAPLPNSSLPDHVAAVGFSLGNLLLGRNVSIEPGCVFDFSHGPIWLDDDVTVRAFTRLAGPSYVGAGSTILGGPLAEVSIGPVCKVHGEVEASIVLGYSNKAHDGFLGHAYLGRWVNLGALTTNSDLKNNYGTIRLTTAAGEVDTGLMKLGCMLGDHVKTAIGTMLNTGTIVGAGSNIFGGMPPKYVRPFTWGSDGEFAADKFVGLAETVMKRRNLELGSAHRAQLERAWQLGRGRS